MQALPRALSKPGDDSGRHDENDPLGAWHPVILVVDDDLAVRETIAEVLRDERYVVATAANGKEALALCRSGLRPAAMLLDLWMPELDGFTTLEVIRGDTRLRDTPVIVITASGDPLDDTVAARAQTVFRKPIDLGRLLDAIERLRLRPYVALHEGEAAKLHDDLELLASTFVFTVQLFNSNPSAAAKALDNALTSIEAAHARGYSSRTAFIARVLQLADAHDVPLARDAVRALVD